MPVQVVAITGARGSGKDTVASILFELNQSTHTIKRCSFNDPIKEVVMSTFGIRTFQEYDTFKRGSVSLPDGREVTGREIIRVLGMQMRGFGNERFIDDMEYRIKCIREDNRYDKVLIIITDLKYKDELKWCKENHIPIIKVKRNLTQYDAANNTREIDDFFCDFVVTNDGMESELTNRLKYINSKIVGA